MSKEILYGQEARAALLRGVDKLADTVILGSIKCLENVEISNYNCRLSVSPCSSIPLCTVYFEALLLDT